jgi:hypothetical protein
VNELTLVMRKASAAAGPGLRLALTSPAVAGPVRLQATATIDAPGAAVAVWTVDGERVGTSQWTGAGSEWRTEITVTLAAGTKLVQVAFGAMIATDALTVQAAAAREIIGSWVAGADPGPLGGAPGPYDADDYPSGSGWGGTPPDPPVEMIEAAATDVGSAMVQLFTVGFAADESFVANWESVAPAGYVNGSVMLRPCGPCLIVTCDGSAVAGDYEFTATLDGETFGPFVLRLT